MSVDDDTPYYGASANPCRIVATSVGLDGSTSQKRSPLFHLGYCIAPEEITTGIRRAHDFLTIGAPHPLQVAALAALQFPRSYCDELTTGYTRRRWRCVCENAFDDGRSWLAALAHCLR